MEFNQHDLYLAGVPQNTMATRKSFICAGQGCTNNIAAVARVLRHCTRIQELYISQVHTEQAIVSLVTAVQPSLVDLELCRIQFRFFCFEDLCQAVKGCANLTRLYLHHVELWNMTGPGLGKVISACAQLKKFELSFTHIDYTHQRSITEAFPKCAHLASLSIRSAGLGYYGLKQVAQILPACPSLLELDLSYNSTEDDYNAAIACVINALPACSVLEEVHMWGMPLNGDTTHVLTEQLPHAKSVVCFNVDVDPEFKPLLNRLYPLLKRRRYNKMLAGRVLTLVMCQHRQFSRKLRLPPELCELIYTDYLEDTF
jgi:hypothetical protein